MGRKYNIARQLDLKSPGGIPRVPDPELLKLAEEILHYFIEMRPEYAPGVVTIPNKALPKFYEAAELAKERGQSAVAFVKSQLDGMAATGSFWPTAIASRKFESVETHDERYARYLQLYKSQLNTYNRLSMMYGPEAVLRDTAIGLTPLFRASIANQLGLYHIQEEYASRARVEREGVPEAALIFKNLRFLDVPERPLRYPISPDVEERGHPQTGDIQN